jgi:hypothetical protein
MRSRTERFTLASFSSRYIPHIPHMADDYTRSESDLQAGLLFEVEPVKPRHDNLAAKCIPANPFP